MVSGLTQCKKNVETLATGNLGETVHIKVNVDNGSRYEIYPGTGAVVYTAGDKIFVGDGSKYLGTLTYASGAFSGYITKPSAGVYLHFYFASGLATTPAELTAGTTSYTVNIASQGTKLPVLSYGKSTSTYTDENATYGCTLLNKCALVNVTLTEGTNVPVTVGGMKTTATIDFATPGITPAAATGVITLYSDSGTSKWGILLPQDAVDNAKVTIGGADYTVDVPQITANGYLAGTNALTIANTAVDYVFSVSSSETVHFSPGNLQYNPSDDAWQFADQQHVIIGDANSNISPDYDGWLDLFGWGTGNNPIKGYNDNSYNSTFDDWGDHCGDPTDNGYHWRTLSQEEWVYLFDRGDGDKYGSATVNGIHGIVLLPDNWTLPTGFSFTDGMIGWDINKYEGDAWTLMENYGAVFLPAAGIRIKKVVNDVGDYGVYWSSTPVSESPSYAWDLNSSEYEEDMYDDLRYSGRSVRLVR